MTTTPATHWYEVTYSVPWIVHNVATAQDAINIAVSQLGKAVANVSGPVRNADISVQTARCRGCNTGMDVATVVSGQALVGLLLTVEVRAKSPEESGIVGRRKIGPHVPDTPLGLVNPREQHRRKVTTRTVATVVDDAEEFFEDVLSENAVMVFPAPTGVLDRSTVLDSLGGADRWQRIEFDEERVVDVGDDVVQLIYRAVAERSDGGSEYTALVTTTYVETDESYHVISHQQTPVGE